MPSYNSTISCCNDLESDLETQAGDQSRKSRKQRVHLNVYVFDKPEDKRELRDQARNYRHEPEQKRVREIGSYSDRMREPTTHDDDKDRKNGKVRLFLYVAGRNRAGYGVSFQQPPSMETWHSKSILDQVRKIHHAEAEAKSFRYDQERSFYHEQERHRHYDDERNSCHRRGGSHHKSTPKGREYEDRQTRIRSDHHRDEPFTSHSVKYAPKKSPPNFHQKVASQSPCQNQEDRYHGRSDYGQTIDFHSEKFARIRIAS